MDGLIAFSSIENGRQIVAPLDSTLLEYRHMLVEDIERGLKLGMDDFKPKPIVKTLHGLHGSATFMAVRSC
jgi:hypothetical protein